MLPVSERLVTLVLSSSIAIALLAGCGPEGPPGDEPSLDAASLRDDAGPPCACGDGEFCCVDRCLPFGSVCGSGPDGGVDAAVDPCASGAFAVCDGPHTLRACAGGATPCNTSFPDCHAFFDPERGRESAGCFATDELPCAASDPPSSCDGATLLRCYANPTPSRGGAYLARVVSCTALDGPDATCVEADGTAWCDIPSAPRCEVGAPVAEPCSADEGARRVCRDVGSGGAGRLVEVACEPSRRCLDGECIPRDAVRSAGAATDEKVALRCDGAGALRVAWHGWEWTEACEPSLVIAPDGSSSSVAQVCYDATGLPRCEPPGTEHCSEDRFAPSCDADGRLRVCIGDTVSTRECPGAPFDAVCDAEVGTCVSEGTCSGPYCLGDFLATCGDGSEPTRFTHCPRGCAADGGGARCL